MTHKQYKIRKRRLAIVAVLAVTFLASVVLLDGCSSLKQSTRTLDYHLVGYWTEANGKPFATPFWYRMPGLKAP